MKNRLSHFLFFVVAVVATAGCKKSFLENMKSYDKFDESMFTSEILTGSYIDRLYNYYFANYKNPMSTVVGLYDGNRSGSTDETAGNLTWTNPNKNIFLASQADNYYGIAPTGVDNRAYTRIRFCNFLIEKINGGVAQALSETFKNTAKGQMYFLRGLQYYDLVRVYGGVPIITTVQDASIDDETIKVPRAKSSEVFDQIVKDFDSAQALLPAVWPNPATDFGRFTSYAALAMKSRVLLTAASPLFNTDWDNPGNAKWQRALDAGLKAEDELGNKGPYGKAITNAKQWGEVTFATDNVFNGEGIIVQYLTNNTTTVSLANYNGWEAALRPAEFKGTGGISVPKDMLDVFPLSDGSRPVKGVNYNDTFFFENREPRFYRTFAFSGSKWGTSTNANHVVWLYRWKVGSGSSVGTFGNNQMTSPAYVRKGSNPKADSTNFAASGTDIFDYRWAELILNIAECYAATGNTAKAVEYLSKLRSRVGIPQGSNNYGIGNPADKYAALEACLYERRVELAYEGKRFWDMQRWMLYDDDAAIGDNTNTKLGIAKLNGTARYGYYWQSKTNGATTTADPLVNDKGFFSIDPEATTAAIKIQTDSLKRFFNNKFVWTPLDKAMDFDNGPVNVLFRSNYYISGLNGSLLSNNPWMQQTIGWQDFNGAMGTFDYRQ